MIKKDSQIMIPDEVIMSKIILIRGQKVMISNDLAELYGVTTKRLNEQVKRNIKRFPANFMFQLTDKEKENVVAICDHLQNLKYSPYLPYAFTEHGSVMLANVLNSERATEASTRQSYNGPFRIEKQRTYFTGVILPTQPPPGARLIFIVSPALKTFSIFL